MLKALSLVTLITFVSISSASDLSVANATLVKQVKAGNLQQVRTLIENGASTNHIDKNSIHLAIYAVQSNNPSLVDYLAAKGMDLNGYGNVAYTPIMIAMQKSADMLKVFIKHSADLDLVSKYASNYSPPLTWGIRKRATENVLLAIEAGADVNALDHFGLPPVLYAFNQRNAQVLQAIFKYGGNPDFTDDNGDTLVTAAVKQNNLELLKVLGSAGADFNKSDNDGNKPHILAVTSGNSQIIEYIETILGIT